MITGIDLQELFDLGQRSPLQRSLAEAARTVRAARDAVDAAEKRLKAERHLLGHAEDVILRLLEQEGRKSFTDPDSGLIFSACTTEYYNVTKADLEEAAFLVWLMRSGGRDLLERSLNAREFTHFCRELEAKGKPISPLVKKAKKRQVRIAERK